MPCHRQAPYLILWYYFCNSFCPLCTLSLSSLSSLLLLPLFSHSIPSMLAASEISQHHVPSLGLPYSLPPGWSPPAHSLLPVLAQMRPSKGSLLSHLELYTWASPLFTTFLLVYFLSLLVKHKLCEGRDFCSWLYAQPLEECLANSSCLLFNA